MYVCMYVCILACFSTTFLGYPFRSCFAIFDSISWECLTLSFGNVGPYFLGILDPIIFGPLQLKAMSRAPKRPKMDPNTWSKIEPKSGSKTQFGVPNLYEDANKDV